MDNPRRISLLVLVLLTLALARRLEAQVYDTNNVVVQTFAGSGFIGLLDGQGQLTEFSGPSQILADTLANLYVWDSGNDRIRKITANATVSTFVGGGGQLSGYGTNVSLSAFNIGTMTIDHSNTIWIAASYISITYFLTIGSDSFVSIENGALPGLTTGSGLGVDSQNNIYYSDNSGNRIYRYNPTTTISQVFAGSGNSGGVDGNGIFTSFSNPSRLVCDSADNIYVSDGNGSRLRRIDQAQNVTTITNASLGSPMCVDNNGNIIFVGGGGGSSYVSKLTVKTNFLLYAGTTGFSSGSYTNGPGNLARFNSPSGACLSQGMIFVSDSGNQRIRQISFNPQTNIVTGANLGIATYAGITITGVVGRTYRIESSANMSTWNVEATILLTSSPYLWIDQQGLGQKKFYRAVLLP